MQPATAQSRGAGETVSRYDVHRPHDSLFRAVFSDPTAAVAFLRAILPESVSTDDELRDSESDLLFAVDRTARVLPGSETMEYSTEFSELFAEEVRSWPWLPRFRHLLIDQSNATVETIAGELKGRIAQLTMLAVYRDHWPVLQRVVPMMTHLYRRGGVDELRPFVIYVLATQGAEIRQRFVAELRRKVRGPGGDAMNYVEQLIQQGRDEGERKGRLEGRVGTIEELLRAGIDWSIIELATGIDRDALRALKQRLDESDARTIEAP